MEGKHRLVIDEPGELSHLIILSKVAQKGEQVGLLEYYGLTVPPELS